MIIFDDMIADMLSDKKRNPIATELFIRGRKLNISLVFNAQFYFAVPNKYQAKFYTLFHYENSKQTGVSTNHSSDIECKDFMNLYKNAQQNHITERKYQTLCIFKILSLQNIHFSTFLKNF